MALLILTFVWLFPKWFADSVSGLTFVTFFRTIRCGCWCTSVASTQILLTRMEKPLYTWRAPRCELEIFDEKKKTLHHVFALFQSLFLNAPFFFFTDLFDLFFDFFLHIISPFYLSTCMLPKSLTFQPLVIFNLRYLFL